MHEQNETFKIETETTKEQPEVLNLKNTMTELNNLIEKYKRGFTMPEKGISDLEVRAFDIIHSEKEKGGKKNEKEWGKPMGLMEQNQRK